MKQQIIVIHGGTSFLNYKNYISFLKNHEINFNKLKSSVGWKDSLGKDLGEDFEVLSPRMPNPMNARYEEWKIWFERIVQLLDDNLIFIGHSLGGIFLAKYLSENKISKIIKTTILIAAPFDNANSEESLLDFKLPNSFERFLEQSENIFLIQSKDDIIVPFEEVEKYKKALPKAKLIVFEDRQHFNQETFPEIIKLIKQI
jgi:predicted alpha/beta hydrolase family esterase